MFFAHKMNTVWSRKGRTGVCMRLVGVVSIFAAATLVFAALLHFPIPYVQLKPLKPSQRVGSISDIRADSPEPPPPTAQNIAKMQSVFGDMCRTSVRSESERRKLDFPLERVNALCGCLVQNAIETRFAFEGKEGFGKFGLIVGKAEASERRALDDAHYQAIIVGAELACAVR